MIWDVADWHVQVYGFDDWVVPRDAQWNQQEDQDGQNGRSPHPYHRKGLNDTCQMS